MANKHILSLEIPAVSNCELLCIKDTSQYSTELAVDCEELLITLPGYSVPILIKVYIVRYSVSPNSKVFVEYNHLKVSSLMSTYYNVLCDLDVQACQPNSTKADLLSEMNFIRTLIDAAVANVEYCASSAQGMQLYNYAKQRLNKISCPSGNCGGSNPYIV